MPIPLELIETKNFFPRVMDPHERLDFTAHWHEYMEETDDIIAEASIVLSSEAVAAGINVLSITWEGKDQTAWINCITPNLPIFNGSGVTVAMLWKITDTRPLISRMYERTMGLRLRQR